MIDQIILYSGHQPTEEFLIDTQKKLMNLDSEDEELKELLIEKTLENSDQETHVKTDEADTLSKIEVDDKNDQKELTDDEL